MLVLSSLVNPRLPCNTLTWAILNTFPMRRFRRIAAETFSHYGSEHRKTHKSGKCLGNKFCHPRIAKGQPTLLWTVFHQPGMPYVAWITEDLTSMGTPNIG